MINGKLTVVGNHVGNRIDIHPRLGKLVEDTSIIICEHRESFQCDLEFIGVTTDKEIFTYPDFEFETETNNMFVEKMKSGDNILFIVDNGMLGFADAGVKLIDACHKAGILVEVVPGPSIISILPAIAGIPHVGTGWTFEEIFHKDKEYIVNKVNGLKDILHNLIILNRHNTVEILSAMLEIFKEDRFAAVCIDIGLPNQKVVRDTLSNLINSKDVLSIDQELTSIVCSGKLLV